jgi:hypothetical protein
VNFGGPHAIYCEYDVKTLDVWTPNIYISRRYVELCRDKNADPKAREFLKRKIQAARWLIEASQSLPLLQDFWPFLLAGVGRWNVLQSNHMAHGKANGAIVNGWMIQACETNLEVAPADPHKVGMIDLVAQSFADNDAQRTEWFFIQAVVWYQLNSL